MKADLPILQWARHKPGHGKHFHISFQHGSKTFAWRDHSHQAYSELACMLSGSMTHTVNGKRVAIAKGDVLLIRENDRHRLDGNKFRMVNVEFPTRKFHELETYLEWPGLFTSLQEQETPPLARVPKDKWSRFVKDIEWMHAHPSGVQANIFFDRFFLTTMQDCFLRSALTRSGTSRLPDWMENALLWLDERRAETVTLADLTKQCFRTPEHVSRSFRKHLGMSPSRYLNNQRLHRAAELLIYSNLSLLDISIKVGFDNPSYFHRLFKQFHGTTPAEYRRAALRSSRGRRAI